MKRLVWFYSIAGGVFCMLIATTQAQQTSRATMEQRFAFKYEVGRPLAYSMGLKMNMDMDMKAGAENMSMKMVFDMRYHVALTPTTDSQQGVTTMRLQPSNIEVDWDITGPGSHIVMSLRGADMKGTQNGVVFIDTAKDIGVAQAQEFKKEILPLYLSGQVDMDSRGNIKQFRGDLPFVEFWTDAVASQVGFFGVVFPERAIAIGDNWQETLSLKKMGQIKLEGEGLRCNVTFTRQPDAVVQGKRMAAFNLSAPFSHKDLTGFIEQMGQSMRLDISQFERRATGTIRFDQERGLLIDGTMKADANGSMNALVQGQALTMELKIEADMRVSLISEKETPAQQSGGEVRLPAVRSTTPHR